MKMGLIMSNFLKNNIKIAVYIKDNKYQTCKITKINKI